VHRDSKAGLGHGESGGETADATPDNRDLHGALISKRSAIMRHLCRERDVWPAIDSGCSIARGQHVVTGTSAVSACPIYAGRSQA
jgi:hypothetical protein